ncbi:efflux transporter periplasmic adaptor subunit [Aliidiomarina minuta]|uniref:Efflux transporter periplasmic adaptor subunit n=1 Tax=Aliidiomarina minuta TaxID=880057 RepID=A0A432W9X6_9GAMM|nr:efflux RND transporter periplasmic adaptor subunit [Aliidiomarina minuta]RUO26914.1 efflux transporter periplasmic adaptor subunit [Aliidiomarina minuta]
MMSFALQGNQERAAQVIVTEVRYEHESQRIESVGTAQALRSVTLYPAVADIVTAIHFSPGEDVSQDQVLLELDSRRQRVAVERASIQLQDAERTLQRLRTSSSQGAVPESEVDDAVTIRDLLEVELKAAETELEDRTLRAPFSGIVGLTDVEVGDRITEQTAITTLDKREQLRINFKAPESALFLLAQKPTLTVQPWQNRSLQLAAEINEIDSRIDINDRTLRVRALLDNEQDLFRPGMSFRVRLELQGDSYAVVPEAALLWGATTAFVWKVEGEQARRVDVQIKQRLPGRLLVSGDLAPGDLLITEGVQSLREGQRVNFAGPSGEGE